jgi:hypothetical protein
LVIKVCCCCVLSMGVAQKQNCQNYYSYVS